MLPIEVQGYIRHVLHLIGVILVAKAGIDQTMMDLYIGAGVNLISLLWFLYTEVQRIKKTKDTQPEG